MKSGKRLLSAGIGCALAISCMFPSYGTKTDVDEARKEADSLEEQKTAVESSLKELEALKEDTAAYVKGLDANLDSLNKQLTALRAQVSAKETEIEEAGRLLEEAKAAESRQYRNMKLRIQYMYEKGETNYLDLLFKSADLTQLFNRAEYISRIAAYDRKMLEAYRESKALVADKEARLISEKEELQSFESSAEAKKQESELVLSKKSAELKTYQQKIAAGQGSLAQLKQDIAAQENKIRTMEAEMKRKEEEARKAAEETGKTYNTVSIGNINFIWPCPSGNRITSGFGDRESPTEGASSNHQGIDISAASGSQILAAASGTVTISTYSYSAGNYVMIHHGGGVYTVYMHCSELLATAGQEVKQGQVIAKVGSTGYSTGPHLHFGVRVNGSYVNPVKYVSP